MSSEPLWLAKARELVGLKEIVGSRHEAKILQFFAEAGHPGIKDDETAWCAAFVGAMLRRGGYSSSGALNARSYLTYGTLLATPRPGCIAVFKRGNSAWQGHVAFFLRDLGDSIEVLGGNQSNSVSIARMSKASLLGYRWPSVTSAPAKVSVPAPVVKPAVSAATKAGTVAAGTVVAGAGAAAVQAGLSAPEILAIITGASLAVGAVIVTGYRYLKGHWPWTGNQSQELSLPSPLPSVKSWELVSAQLALSSEDSPETLSPPPLELKRPRKQSAKPSRKTRTPRKSSSASKAKKASKSSPKRKSKSRS